MTIILIALALTALFVLLTLHEVLADDRGHRSPPPSRLEDPLFQAPWSRL